jgi:hypothetical protein
MAYPQAVCQMDKHQSDLSVPSMAALPSMSGTGANCLIGNIDKSIKELKI